MFPRRSKPLPQSAGVLLLIAAVQARAGDACDAPGLNLWLAAVLERHPNMVRRMMSPETPEAVLEEVRGDIHRGDPGPALPALLVAEVADEVARCRGLERVYERDLVLVVLEAASRLDGFERFGIEEVLQRARPVEPAEAAHAGSGLAGRDPIRTPSSASEAPAAAAVVPVTPPPSSSKAPAAGVEPSPGQPASTPTLDQIGRDITKLAREGKLTPVIGREAELTLVIETLCRRTVRNPLLVGPAGVGKTAIVEGLARRLVAGEVPEMLRGLRIVEIQASMLSAGGDIGSRIKRLVAEAAHPGIVLFLDEVHSLVGLGGYPGTTDAASLLKPALARGALACIAATTDEEHRRFVEKDSALDRRFQPIRVQEPTPGQTRTILLPLAAHLAADRRVAIPDAVVDWVIDFAERFLRNRHFPAKAVDLLEQVVAFALTHGRSEVGVPDAEAVGRRLVGMPTDTVARVRALAGRLGEGGLLAAEDAQSLTERLHVTLAGLDIRPHRPNATLLLVGRAAQSASSLAEGIATTVFGAADRVVQVDLARYVEPEDVWGLLGSAAGFVGYGDTVPIHRVRQMPWCVLRFDNVHACHPQVIEVIVQALENGYFTDGAGRRVHVSDTVVLLTTVEPPEGAVAPRLGFRRNEDELETDDRATLRRSLGSWLGARLVRQCDLLTDRAPGGPDGRRRRLEREILPILAERHRREGLAVEWHPEVVEWLLGRGTGELDTLAWERLVEEHLGAPLARFESETHGTGPRRARVVLDAGVPSVVPMEAGAGEG